MCRFYTVNGLLYPSVTTILSVVGKPTLAIWEKKVCLNHLSNKIQEFVITNAHDHTKVLSSISDKKWMDNMIANANEGSKAITMEAATLGTRAHTAFEAICKGVEIEVDAPIQPLIKGFLKWKDQEPNLHIIEVETMVHSHKHKYAGTIDAVAIRNTPTSTGIVVLDWKTSNQIYSDYALQAAAYAKAWEEMNSQKVSEAWIIRMDKYQPKFEAKKVKCIDSSFDLFLSCLKLYSNKTEDQFE